MHQNRLIYKLDLLARNPTLFSFGNERKKTLFGFIMTVFLFIILVIMTFYFLFDWLNGNDFSLNFNLYTIQENTSIPFNLTKIAFTTNFKIGKEFNLSFYYKNEINEIFNINFSVCNPNQEEDKKVLYCFNDLNNNIFYLNNVFEGIIIFYSEIIVNVTSDLNFEKETLNEFTLNPPRISFFFDNLSYQNYNRKYPIQHIGIQFSSTFPLLYTTIYNYSLIFSNYKTDDGYIFTDKKSYDNVILNQKPFITSNLKENNSNFLGCMSLSLSPYNAEQYKRKFIKLHEILSQFGGIISLLNMIFDLIVEFFTRNFFYYNLVFKVLNVENHLNKNNDNHSINIFKKKDINNSSNNNNSYKQFKNVNQRYFVLESLNGIKKKNNPTINNLNSKKIYLHTLKIFDYFCFKFEKNIKKKIKLCINFCKEYLSCEKIIFNNCYNEKFYQIREIKKSKNLFDGKEEIPDEKLNVLQLNNK